MTIHSIDRSLVDRRRDEGVTTAMATVSLVIPAKNEERNIAWVLRRIPALVDEVVLVDGHSVDRTVETARWIRPDIRVITESRRGKGAALRTGFAAATGDLVVMLDADCSMDPVEIQSFVDRLADGAELVKGSRFLPGGGTADMTRARMIGNRVLVRLVNLLYGSDFSELCYGFMAFRRRALEVLDLRSDGFEIETEIVVRAVSRGLSVVEVPSYEDRRRFGTSNLNAIRDGIRVLRTVLRHRFNPQPALASAIPRIEAAVSGATPPRLAESITAPVAILAATASLDVAIETDPDAPEAVTA
jgi:glycosyltransferase involved in cell wall biosynthesis